MDMQPKIPVEQIITDMYNGDKAAFLRDVKQYFGADEHTVMAPRDSFQIAADAPVVIELKNVERSYKITRKNQVPAVRGVTMQVREGEIVALTGPSGSGKSTVMHLIGGLDRPTAGEVIVDGRSIGRLPESKLAKYRNQTIGFVFQFFYLQPFLRVNRNVEVPLMFARSKVTARQALIDEIIRAVDLDDKLKAFPKELSGGQMQRVAIARALVNRPKILLADEPTGNLDSKTSDRIMALLHDIRRRLGTTMIIVTHDPRVASWADRTIRIEDGKIAA